MLRLIIEQYTLYRTNMSICKKTGYRDDFVAYYENYIVGYKRQTLYHWKGLEVIWKSNFQNNLQIIIWSCM